MAQINPPAPRPCTSCPYRRDVPSGVWAPEEYEKLPAYHDTGQMLTLRFAAVTGSMTPEAVGATLDYVSPVPLFRSGAEAAGHGLAEVERPGGHAFRTMSKIARRRGGLKLRED